MRKIFLLLSLTYSLSILSNLPDGTILPNFTFTDEQGVSHNIYDNYLDKGTSVILEITTSNCEPCWQFHQSGQIQELYSHYGPQGSILQNAVMPILLESDPKTTRSCFSGNGDCGDTNSYGDWSAGIDYPIYNPSAKLAAKFIDDYKINEYPAIYVISPSGYIKTFKGTATSYEEIASYAAKSFQMHNSAYTITGGDCEPTLIDLTPFQGEGQIRYTWSTGQTTQDITAMESGDYFVTMTDENNYNAVIGPITVNLVSSLSVEVANQNNVTCNGDANGSINLNVHGGSASYNFLWSNGAAASNIGNLIAGTYTVTITDLATNCSTIRSFIIDQPTPILSTITTNNIPCDDVFGTINIETQGGIAPYRFIVNGATYNSSSIIIPEGIHTVSTIDAYNCMDVQSVEIKKQIQPVAQASVSGIISCNNSSVQLSANGSTLGENISYQWLDSQGIEVGSHKDIIVTRAGEYTLTLRHSNSDCTATTSVNVESEKEVPTAAIVASGNLDCNNSIVQLSGSGSSQGSDYIYNWSTENGEFTGSSNQFSVTVSSAGRYLLMVTNLVSGCSSSSEVIIGEEEKPQINITGNTTFCAESSTQLCIDKSDNQSVQWFIGDQMISEESCISISASTEVSAVLSNNLSGCSNTESFSTNRVELPNASFTGQTNFCEGEAALLCFDEENQIEKIWYSQGQILSRNTCITINEITEIELQATNTQNGCTQSQSAQIEELELPYLQVEPVQDLSCENPVSIITISTNANSEDVVWTDESGHQVGRGMQLSVTSSGTYIVTVSNLSGCEAFSSVTVNEEIDLPQVHFPEPAVLNCANQFSTLVAEIIGDEWNIFWTNEAGNNIGAGNELEVSDAGVYTAILSNGNGCELLYEVIVSENADLPVIGEIESVIFDCDKGYLRLQPIDSNLDAYRWTNGLGVTLSVDNFLDVTEAGVYILYGSNTFGCTSVERIEIESTDLGVPSSAFDLAQNINGEVSFINHTTGNVQSYEWNFGDGNISTETNPIHQYSESGDYVVTLITTHSCGISEMSIAINVDADNQTTSIDKIEGLEHFVMHPNPASSTVHIDAILDKVDEVVVTITNTLGELVITENVQRKEVNLVLNVAQLEVGVYNLQMSTANGSIVQQLIIAR